MHLDTLTLMVPGAIATALTGVFLFGAWLHFRSAPALRWWAAANGIYGIGLAALTVGLAAKNPLISIVGVGSITIVPALIWGGVKVFNNEKPRLPLLAIGTIVWLATAIAPSQIDHQRWSALANFASWTVYLSAAIWCLWKTREEKLNARWPLAALLALHATIFFGAACEVLSGSFEFNEPPGLDTFFGAIHFETLAYAMGTAIFMVLLCKERVEIGYLASARVDALTGTANRGALFEDAARLFERSQHGHWPFSLIMFDLDYFKSINDSLGHQAGDRLLSSFAGVVRAALRPSDLVGRYGGEEFVVILPGATIDVAYSIADRVRRAFADSHRTLDDRTINATVSAGVASASSFSTLEEVVGAADKALYVAKRTGRNRVERAYNVDVADSQVIVKIA